MGLNLILAAFDESTNLYQELQARGRRFLSGTSPFDVVQLDIANRDIKLFGLSFGSSEHGELLLTEVPYGFWP